MQGMHSDYQKTNYSGWLISFEGGEGSGKTTQISRIRSRLEDCGQQVVVLREPGGTPIAEQIREVVLSSKNVGIAYTAEVLLFQAARAQLYREVVIPSLESGKIVLMDRTRDSSVVYQGIVRGFGQELIEQLNDISTKNILPTVTFLLDVDPEIGLARRGASEDEINRLDMESQSFHQKVRSAYLSLIEQDKNNRWVKIDASQKIDQIENAIWQEVRSRGLCG